MEIKVFLTPICCVPIPVKYVQMNAVKLRHRLLQTKAIYGIALSSGSLMSIMAHRLLLYPHLRIALNGSSLSFPELCQDVITELPGAGRAGRIGECGPFFVSVSYRIN